MEAFDLSIIIVSAILAISIVLLITEILAVDKIAVGIMVILSLTGILTPKEAVAGFSNAAVITVGAMFLISRGLIRTGAVGFITEIVLNLSKGRKELAFILILITVAFASPKVMPDRTAPVCELDETKEERYIAELIVPENSPLTQKKH
jgi:di/tricarboxylate transporter